MPLNISASGTTSNISFGPATIKMGPIAGNTPSTDVGFIGEDGVTVEMTSEKKIISQGNPRLPLYSFVQAQDVMLNFTSIQWDFDNFIYALGGGTTSGGGNVFQFGGNALNELVAIQLEHQMAVTNNTMMVYVWKAQSESGFTVPFGQDEHSFEFQFRAIRAADDWSGAALADGNQLIKFERLT